MPKLRKRFSFIPKYRTLQEILADQELATLGDAYVNLLYSLYLSSRTKRPTGVKADSRILADALKHSGLRGQVVSRADRHKQADAAEALLVYAWLQEKTSITECLAILLNYETSAEAFSSLLSHARERLSL
jgi:hypothetical protein